MNHFLYADDTCVLAPSPSGLQKLLNICSKYAEENCLIFNESKTKCLCFKPQKFKNLYLPTLYLNNQSLLYVTEVKYLGILLSANFKDDIDILRHVKYMYSSGNLIVNRFKHCSSEVKHLLFKTFCISLYGCMLWSIFSNESIKKCCVAFNNIYRALFNIKRGESISHQYVSNNIDSFTVLLRKSIHGFMCRLGASDNVILKCIYSSQHYMFASTLHTKWRHDLYL